MKRDEAIVKLRAARRVLFDSLAGVSDEELTRPNAVATWSIQDLLGHIAAWDEETLRTVQAFSMQATPLYSYTISDRNDFAAWNAEQSQLRQNRSLQQIRWELDNARRDLIQVIEGLTDQVLMRSKVTPWGRMKTGFEVLQDAAEHDLEHARDVQSWRKKRDRWARARQKYMTKRRETKKKSPGESKTD
ncbi:MAG: DinB family protein [Anaerolineae bacterium]